MSLRNNRFSPFYRPSQIVEAAPLLALAMIVLTVVALAGLAMRAVVSEKLGTAVFVVALLIAVILAIIAPFRAAAVRARKKSGNTPNERRMN